MSTRERVRLALPVAVIAAAVLATGCTASEPGSTGSASPSASASTPAAAPEPSPTTGTFTYPDTEEPTQVAITLKYDGDDPSGEIIAGPAVLEADRAFTVEGQCDGSGIGFEVVSADGEKRVLAEGDFDCAEPPAGEFTYQLPYAGPIQVNLTDTDDVDRAWVRVIQP